jgi:hypothetical protein
MFFTMDGVRVVTRKDGHLDQHSDVLPLLQEVLKKIDTGARSFLVGEVAMGRSVGTTSCVLTSGEDEIVFATRVGRDGPTRFVKQRALENCSYVTVVLKKDFRAECYVVITAFVGRKAEREPWDRNIRSAEELNASKRFWSTHALVWGSQEVISGTVTTQRSW